MSPWSCPLCAHENTEDAVAPRLPPSVVQCRRCGLYTVQPRPQSVLPFYPSDYEPFWLPVAEEPNPVLRWEHRRHYEYRCQALRQIAPSGGVVLDVGCGTGGFLAALCHDGLWQGVGVDFAAGAVQVARRQGVSARLGELSDLRFPDAEFDAVTLWEVIEHVLDPLELIQEIHRILKPGGRLWLSTPNGESWQARFWRQFWRGWDPPRHLQVFSPQSLAYLLRLAGFEAVRKWAFPQERYYLVASARQWRHARGWRVEATELLSDLLGIAAWPWLRLIDHSRFASAMVVEARLSTS